LSLLRSRFVDGVECRHGGIPRSVEPSPTPARGVIKCVLQDAEVSSCTVAVEFLHPLAPSPDASHLESDVVRRLFSTILDRRLTMLLRGGASSCNCPPCILDFAVSSRPVLPTLLNTSTTATVAAQGTDTGVSVGCALSVQIREMQRIATHGVSEGEVAYAVASWQSAFAADRPVSSADIAEDCLQHFRLAGRVPLAGPEKEGVICREFLSHRLVASRVNDMAKQFDVRVADTACRVCVQCGPTPSLDVDALWAVALSETLADPAPLWERAVSGVHTLRSQTSALAAIVPLCDAPVTNCVAKPMPSIDAVEFTLGNGVVACCLRRATPGRVALQAFALGGSTELDEADECAMCVLDDVVLSAGLSPDLDAVALRELSSASQTRVNTQRHLYHRGIGGSTLTGQFGLLLDLAATRLRLGTERFEVDSTKLAVERTRARLLEEVGQRHHDPNFWFGQRARLLSCNGVDIPVLRPVSEEAVRALTTARCARLHTRGFAEAPGKFTFVFVGDLPPDGDLLEMLSSRLGGLATKADPWTLDGAPSQLPSGFANGVVEEEVLSETAEKATTLIIFHAKVCREDAGVAHLEHFLHLEAARRCAQDRMLARLRGEAGGVYSVSVALGRVSLSPHAHITVSFDSDAARQSVLAGMVVDELRKLQQEGPSSQEVLAIRQALKDTHARNLSGAASNSYWLFYVLEAYKGKRLGRALGAQHLRDSVEEVVWAASHGYADNVDRIDVTCLKAVFAEHFRLDNYVHLVLKPGVSAQDGVTSDTNLAGEAPKNTSRI